MKQAEQMEEPALCQAILTAVSDGASDPKKLSKQIGMPYDNLQRQLYFLRLLKLIDNNNSVHDPISSLRVGHTIAEPALSPTHWLIQEIVDVDTKQIKPVLESTCFTYW